MAQLARRAPIVASGFSRRQNVGKYLHSVERDLLGREPREGPTVRFAPLQPLRRTLVPLVVTFPVGCT